jgi:hypothetical protein
LHHIQIKAHFNSRLIQCTAVTTMAV